jgi:hypothetical protein
MTDIRVGSAGDARQGGCRARAAPSLGREACQYQVEPNPAERPVCTRRWSYLIAVTVHTDVL